jgi:hypothetical protein
MPSFVILDVKSKMSQEAHIWLPAAYQMVKQVFIDHTPCHQFTKRQLL